MTETQTAACPKCCRVAYRHQPSAPAGTQAAVYGPHVVYPCMCWILPGQAAALARDLRAAERGQ